MIEVTVQGAPIQAIAADETGTSVEVYTAPVTIVVNELVTSLTGEDKNYVHTQNTPATEWIVNHNLGKYPAVTVVDSANNEIEVEVEHVDTNTAKLYLAFAVSGKAFFN